MTRGDYYDFLLLGDGKLGLLLADVSVKGMSAALLGASLHAAIRANAPGAGARCGEVLAKANVLLFETTTPERFATVFYGVYDPAARNLTYANAGHCPPMLVRRDERGNATCIRLGSITPPAGMMPVLPALQHSAPLVPGDWLLIFSDGIPEAASESGDISETPDCSMRAADWGVGRPRKCARGWSMKCEITPGNRGSRTTSP
jgi:phosphoserine phosphatase RsbU/P